MPGIKGAHTLFVFLAFTQTQLIAPGIEIWAGEWVCLERHWERLSEAGRENLGIKWAQWLFWPIPEQTWTQHTHESRPTHPSSAWPCTMTPPACKDWQPAAHALPVPALDVPWRHFSAHLGLPERSGRSHGRPECYCSGVVHLLWAAMSSDSPKAGRQSQPSSLADS